MKLVILMSVMSFDLFKYVEMSLDEYLPILPNRLKNNKNVE